MVEKAQLDKTYIKMAHVWGNLSHAKRRKVGAIVVRNGQIISDGYNGTPRGFDNVCEADGKTIREVLHAESNAIAKLAKSSQSSDGATLYVTLSPCLDCAKLIHQAGICRVVYDETYSDSEGLHLLSKLGVEVDKL